MKLSRAFRSGLLVMVAVLLVALPVLAACAKEAKPAVKKTIKVGEINDLTGPIASTGVYWHQGWQGYWNYVNDEEGGIRGYKVETPWWDFKYDLPTGLSQYEDMKTKGVVAFWAGGSHILAALRPKIDQDRIALVVPRGPLTLFQPPPGYGFSVDTIDGDILATGLDWYYKNVFKKDRPLKIAYLFLDTVYGRSPMDSGGKAWLDQDRRFELVRSEPVPALIPDMTVQLTKIRDSGADIIVWQVMLAELAVLARDMKKLGMTTPHMGPSPTNFYMRATAPEGFPAPLYYPAWAKTTWDKGIPGIEKVRERQMKFFGKVLPEDAFWWWILGVVTKEGIERAIDKVGIDKLDGTAVKEALETIKDWNAGGVSVPLTFTSRDHLGAATVDIRYAAPGDLEPKIIAGPIPTIDTLPLLFPEFFKK